MDLFPRFEPYVSRGPASFDSVSREWDGYSYAMPVTEAEHRARIDWFPRQYFVPPPEPDELAKAIR